MRDTRNDLRFVPEIFFCYKDYLSFGGGYSFVFGGTNFEDVSPYRVSLTYNFLK